MRLLLIPFFLFAAQLDFSPCYKKFSFIDKFIPISKTKSITFCKVKDYISYDPFTGIYVVKAKNKKVVKFEKSPKLGWWMAGIKKNSVFAGSYAKKMLFFSPALLSVKTPKNSVISDLFCRAYGVSRGDGFIEGDYIKHFIKSGYYGDIGVYVNENLVVEYIDPFYVKGIKRGDKVLKINGKKATIDSYKRYVLFGKLNKNVKITTKQGTFLLKIRKRRYHFTPLLKFEIVVDKNLNILHLPKWIEEKVFVKPPAKLIAINGKRVTSFDEVRKIDTKNVTITIQKDGINIDVRLGNGISGNKS